MYAILEHDFLRAASRRKFFWLRTGFFGLPYVFATIGASGLSYESSPDRIGSRLFNVGTTMLVFCICLVTPAMVSDVLATERRGNKLEVLRSTALSLPGIVFGKWLSRLGLLLTMCVAAMAVVAISLVFGGVSRPQLCASGLVMLLGVLSTSAVGCWASASTADLSAAGRRAYLAAAILAFGPSLLSTLLSGIGSAPPGTLRAAIIDLPYGSCNPFVAMGFVASAGRPDVVWRSLADPCGVLGMYTIFTVAATGLGLAMSLRAMSRGAVAVRRAASPVAAAGRASRWWTRHSTALLTRFPLVWLELVRGRRGRWMTVPRLLAVGGVIAIEGLFLLHFIDDHSYGRTSSRRDIWSTYTLASGLCLGLAFLLAIVGGAVSMHRDRSLEATDLLHASMASNRDLILGKLVGAVVPAIPFVLLGTFHVLLGAITGELLFFAPLGWLVGAVAAVTLVAAASMVNGLQSSSARLAVVSTLIRGLSLTLIAAPVGCLGAMIGADAFSLAVLSVHPLALPFAAAGITPARHGWVTALTCCSAAIAIYLYGAYIRSRLDVHLPNAYQRHRRETSRFRSPVLEERSFL